MKAARSLPTCVSRMGGLCFLLFAAAGFGGEPTAAVEPALIDVGGRVVEIERCGKSGMTVVFEGGSAATAKAWSKILPHVGAYAAALSYSRAGFGQSEPSSQARTPGQIAEELHALLAAADRKPPYVLVARSLGGIYLRAFAAKYPREVAGVVLIDSSHERQKIEFTRVVPGYEDRRREVLARLAGAQKAESEAAFLGEGFVGEPPTLPDVPTAILTPMNIGGAHGPAMAQVWRELHAELFKATSRGMHTVTSKSGQGIVEQEPELVLNAIRWVVDAAQEQSRLAPPAVRAVGGEKRS